MQVHQCLFNLLISSRGICIEGEKKGHAAKRVLFFIFQVDYFATQAVPLYWKVTTVGTSAPPV